MTCYLRIYIILLSSTRELSFSFKKANERNKYNGDDK